MEIESNKINYVRWLWIPTTKVSLTYAPTCNSMLDHMELPFPDMVVRCAIPWFWPEVCMLCIIYGRPKWVRSLDSILVYHPFPSIGSRFLAPTGRPRLQRWIQSSLDHQIFWKGFRLSDGILQNMKKSHGTLIVKLHAVTGPSLVQTLNYHYPSSWCR